MAVRKLPRLASAATALAVSSAAMLALTSSALADTSPKVYFIGDSVTAGFGHCGTEGGPNSSGIDCTPNQPFANAWYFGQNSLYSCTPLDPPNDRCSNNNDKGQPWNAGAWSPGPDAPSVAYSYVIARRQAGTTKAAIDNWAMTGATPAQRDPSTDGIFSSHLTAITNSYVVMTLGANPLLSDYVKIKAGLIHLVNGKCANSTLHELGSRFGVAYFASPLNNLPGGVLNCFDSEWLKLDQTQHLINVFKALIQQSDHVLVLGYPPICPWTFGNWQPQANVIYGPAEGTPAPARPIGSGTTSRTGFRSFSRRLRSEMMPTAR